ncbi:hypothetical protein PIB30_066254 [Stylosanthes scabra]|uniref:Uncharacterized protein n=1 Tax=Stylosanthes scabra TaxID=79078 RepID=A0ABU6ZL27_9FABA|nr:hypothetical protein [Stylosanthes scabra]
MEDGGGGARRWFLKLVVDGDGVVWPKRERRRRTRRMRMECEWFCGGGSVMAAEVDAANLFSKTIRNNPTSASDQVVSTRVGYRSQRGKGINQYFLIILQLDQTN